MTGEELKNARLDLRLSRRELGELIQVDQITIWRWETERSKPSKVYISLINKVILEVF